FLRSCFQALRALPSFPTLSDLSDPISSVLSGPIRFSLFGPFSGSDFIRRSESDFPPPGEPFRRTAAPVVTDLAEP
ncbi:hypothetical protein ACFQ6B_40005, partial [Streptomyces wedmorensis]|uniref:hypothetical protein n=1 Tax=Streptomyces wedmorensis TaxID=43759 RepID=UPI0036A7C175